MTLFTRATELQVLLEAANAADASDELLSRGRVIRDDLLEAAEHLENVRAYRSVIGREDVQPLEAKVIRQAVGGFRGALSRSGPKALQQQAAATLLKVLVEQTKRTDRWVIASWQENFVPAQGLLSRTEAGGLHGSPAHRAMATSRASIISAARSTDPVRERTKLEGLLKADGLSHCLERVAELVGELREAIEAMDAEQAAMTPEVRAVLEQAGTDGGLPLSQITPELLTSLQYAGVLDDLVVRRS